MPEQRGAGRGVAGILGCIAIVAGAIIGIRSVFFSPKTGGAGATGSAGATIDGQTALAALAESARSSDPAALVEIQRRIAAFPTSPVTAYTEDEARAWLDVLNGLRSGFLGCQAPGRAVSLAAACRIFQRFAAEPAPNQWNSALRPLFDMFSAGMADAAPIVRTTALGEVAKLWVWLPGRSVTEAEEKQLVEWKEGIYRPVVRCLGQRDPETIVAAIACLGELPVDQATIPALAYLDNAVPAIRRQTLESLKDRPLVLTDDLLLTRLHDADPLIQSMAGTILKNRGLSQEQISLGALIFSPKASQRMSVIPLLKDYKDLDPAVWLIQLSRDHEENVRLSAVEAMAALTSPSIRRRLTEMARSDVSEAVRKAAGKVMPPVQAKTASLPPLPGSASLNPRAN